MKLVLRNVTGETITLEVNEGDTFRDLKARIYEQSGIQLDLEQLNFKGKRITDDQIITKYFFEELTVSGNKRKKDCLLNSEVTLGEEIQQNVATIEECSVPGCNNTVTLCPGKTFFNFPTEDDRCQHWLLVCKRLDLLDKLSVFVSQYHAICQDHFHVDQFVDDLRVKLKDDALPSIIDVDYLGDEEEGEGDNILGDDSACLTTIKDEPYYIESDSDDGDHASDVDEAFLDGDENQPGLLCRLCATNIATTVVFIYSPTGKEMNIAQKINMALPVAVRSGDPLPKQLCMPCLDKVNLSHEFSEQCIQAERKLRRLHRKQVFKSTPVPADPLIVSEDNMETTDSLDAAPMDEEAKLSDEEKPFGCDSFCCPLCGLGDMGVHTDEKHGSMHTEVRKMDGIPCNTFNDSDNSSAEDNADIDDEETLGTHNETSTNDYYFSEESRTCRFCALLFDTVELCLGHGKSHADQDIFPCNLCDLSFYTEPAFEKHWDAHKVRDTKITCRTCGRLISKINMHEHVCGNTLKAFKCLKTYCGKFFRSEERLSFHQRVHDGADPVVCGHCNKTFSRETNLFDHVRMVHKGEKPFVCTTCGKSFQLKGRLQAHQRVHTGERPFECEICGGKFYNNATLKGHRVTHLALKPFQCDKCGRCFARKALFNQHQMVHMTDDIPKQQRACKLCGDIVFGSYAKLLEHRKANHPGAEVKEEEIPSTKPFKCEECGKSFAYRVTLVTHLRKHTGELPFDCQYCEKRFSQKRSLILHERTHTGEKPFECEVCGKRFAQSAHMYSHVRLHTGEKPYACDHCDATFRLKDVRDAHVRKHTGERPYKCEVCAKTFRTSHSYYQHMWIHQGKKPYPCGFCGKAFRRSNGLKIHIRIHTGEKPHACEVCGRGFAQKQDMKKHMNLHLNGKL